MDIPERFRIAETECWMVNHRITTALPGYLMVGTKQPVTELASLSPDALTELGPLLARIEAVMRQLLGAKRVYVSRYGHAEGHNLHFHLIPIYPWVEDLFWQDPRYRLLETFASGPGETPTDGAELTLFVWREFCERPDPPPVSGPTIKATIDMLRNAFR